MESQAVFQAETQAKNVSIESPPCSSHRFSPVRILYILAASSSEGGSLPAALRKAMVEKFEEFDEYQLAKYNRERKGIMVRKTICMYVHVYVTDNP